jgi:alcohol dehydrogenase class IV
MMFRVEARMKDLAQWAFMVPTQVEFGQRSSHKLGAYAAGLGYRSALVVVDPVVHQSGAADPALASMRGAGIDYDVWTRVRPNPLDTDVEAAADVVAAEPRDAIIGIGGGSALDTATGVAMLASNGGRVRDYEGVGQVPLPSRPQILIPTTAGTGGEVTPNVSISKSDTGEKMTLRDKNNFARLAILDPSLLAGLPRSPAAAAAMDALTHAIESHVSSKASPLSRLLSLEAARRLSQWIDRFVSDRADPEAAGEMLYGSCLAGMAIANAGTGAAHAVVRALGGAYDVSHGLACAAALQPVMEFNASHAMDRYAELGRAMRMSTATIERDEAVARAISGVAEIRDSVGIASKLDLCLDDATVSRLSVWAAANAGPNPRPTTAEDAAALIRAVTEPAPEENTQLAMDLT